MELSNNGGLLLHYDQIAIVNFLYFLLILRIFGALIMHANFKQTPIERMENNLQSKFEKIISQKLEMKFQSLGLGMLFTRLIGKYKANPTPETMKACVADVNAFVAKYESVLKEDLENLSRK